jgi:hypothetical protein
MAPCREIGGRAPRSGRKPDRLGAFDSRFLHVCGDGKWSPKHDDEVNSAWNIVQAGVGRQPGDIRAIGADWNDVVAFMREILRNLVTVTIGTRAGADDRDRSGPLQHVSHDALGRGQVSHGMSHARYRAERPPAAPLVDGRKSPPISAMGVL